MKHLCTLKKIFTVVASLWIAKVFLLSLPYKFSGHEHTQFIFGTIGDWIGGFLWGTIWGLFGNYAAYIIGTGELIASILLLFSSFVIIANGLGFLKNKKPCKRGLFYGWLISMMLMGGAVFFHTMTPLGIAVNGDGGSLFRAAVSILILGAILAFLYRKHACGSCKKHA